MTALVPVRLRPLTVADLERVVELERDLFGRDAWSREVYLTELAFPGRYYVAAVEAGAGAGSEDDAGASGADVDGTLVGYAGIALAEDAEVMTVGVVPERRGRGIGALLVDDLVTRARDARVRRVFLEVRAGNESARRLYERAGFRSIGTRPRYYGDEDAVAMRLVLRAGVGDLA